MNPDLRAILDWLDAVIAAAAPEQVPAISLALASRLGALAARSMNGQAASRTLTLARSEGTLLTRKEAATRLGVAVSWLSRRRGKLPFEVRLGRRVPRYNSDGIDRYISSRKARG